MNFLRNSSDSDLLHDVKIRIKRSGFPDTVVAAHLFILASRSRYLSRLIATKHKQLKDKNQTITKNCPDLIMENVHPEILQDCFEYIYSGKMATYQEDLISKDHFHDLGPPVIYWDGAERTKALKSAAQAKLQNKGKKTEITRQFLLNSLIAKLDVHNVAVTELKTKRNSESDNSVSDPNCGLEPTSLPHLYDCVIRCNSVSYSAHKCILAARIPYFSGMLFSPWLNLETDITVLKVSGSNSELSVLLLIQKYFGLIYGFELGLFFGTRKAKIFKLGLEKS